MNKNIFFAALAVLLTAGATARAQSMVKIGTVNMKEIFDSYYKTKEAEQRISERRNQSKNEEDERVVAYGNIVAEIKKISEEMNNPALGNDAKARKKQELDGKIAEREIKEREINEFRRTREKQLQEESARMRASIVDDIKKVIMEKGEGWKLRYRNRQVGDEPHRS
jgi:Skp family chaperone for outer membrane proteins